MILANAYLCYKYEESIYHPGYIPLTYVQFLNHLTHQLSLETEQIPVISVAEDTLRRIHKLASVAAAPKYASRECSSQLRLVCKICKARCSHYCIGCSSDAVLFPVHDPNNPHTAHPGCLEQHHRNLHNDRQPNNLEVSSFVAAATAAMSSMDNEEANEGLKVEEVKA